MDAFGSIKRIKLEHSYAYSKEFSDQYRHAGDPEEDPLLISPEDVKVEINHDFIVKNEEPDEYSCGVDENVTNFQTSTVIDQPVKNEDDNYFEQKTSEETVCKTEVEETVECSKNITNNVASSSFALTNCFSQFIPNTIVIPNFSQLENQNAVLKRSLEDLNSTNSKLCAKADKLTAANLKIKLEIKALKKENGALKKENYNVLSKSETGQLDVRKLELELRCSKAREKVLEKKMSLLRAQAMRKPIRNVLDTKTALSALSACLEKCRMEKVAIQKKQFEVNKKYLEQEAELREIKQKTKQANMNLVIENDKLAARLVLIEQTAKVSLREASIFKSSLENSRKMQIKYQEELDQARWVILNSTMMHRATVVELEEKLAEQKKLVETLISSNPEQKTIIDDYKKDVKSLKAKLGRWKQKYNREKALKVKDQMNGKNCQYCGL